MAIHDLTSTARIGELQLRQQREEFRTGLRALLMQPLMPPTHEAFAAVRRQGDKLRDWFMREAGWPLQVEREGARLYKRPADLLDATRGLEDFDRRRYVLLCLACAVLERSDPQITLHLLGERVMEMALEPSLASRDFNFSLRGATERRELVTVCRSLLELGVLQRVAGDEDSFVRDDAGSAQGDALYDVQRRLLAGMLVALRGPSTWPAESAPVSLDARLEALAAEHVSEREEGQRAAFRHALTRRLLDDPVVYTDALEGAEQAYFINQRGVMAARLCEATGLTAEQRAEGLALTDETGGLTDVAMPAEGTEAHVTLLVAERFAASVRATPANDTMTEDAVAAFIRGSAERFGRFWRKSAREPGAERELARIALKRLSQLNLIAREPDDRIRPLPAIARFAIGTTDTVPARKVPDPAPDATLF